MLFKLKTNFAAHRVLLGGVLLMTVMLAGSWGLRRTQAAGAAVAQKHGQQGKPAQIPLARTIRAVNATAVGGMVTVPIELDAQGSTVAPPAFNGEFTVSFSVNFDPALLSNPVVSRGSGITASFPLTVNTSQAAAGRVGLIVEAPNFGQDFGMGVKQIATISFTVIGGPTNGTPVTFGDMPIPREVGDEGGNVLPTTYTNGSVTIGGGRTISAGNVNGAPNGQVTIPIELNAQGSTVAPPAFNGEFTVSFSVNFDPALLSNPVVSRGSGITASFPLTVNTSQAAAGRVGLIVEAPNFGQDFGMGVKQIATISFTVIGGPTNGTPITFGDMPIPREVGDEGGNVLPTTYSPGSVLITFPTLAQVRWQVATRYEWGNLISWETELEIANLGFQIYRLRNTECQTWDEKGIPAELCLERVTPELIAGSALWAGAQTRLTAGRNYAWQDIGASPEAIYWVKDLDLKGRSAWHGPVSVVEAGRQASLASSSPLLAELGRPGRAGENDLVVREGPTIKRLAQGVATIGSDAWQQQLALAAGAAVKIGVRARGWQHVGGALLLAAGLPAQADSRFLQLYRDGQEVPLLVQNAQGQASGEFGANGFIEFYGEGLDTRESGLANYWLVVGETPGLRLGPPVRVAPPGASTNAKILPTETSSFIYTVERKERTLYFGALRNGEETENFFGPVVSGASVSQVLSARHLAADARTPAQLKLKLQGATEGAHRVQITINGHDIGQMTLNGQENRTQSFALPLSLLSAGDNAVTLRTLGGEADIALLDTVQLAYPRRYQADNNQLLLTTGTRRGLTVGGFTTPQVRVFDVTNTERPFAVAAYTRPAGDGSYEAVIAGYLNGRTLYVVGDTVAQAPASVTANAPTNWTNSGAADLLIVTVQDLRAAVEPLAEARRAQGLVTQVVNIEDIYDEWSGGVPNSAALSGFLRWAHTRWRQSPNYLLLVGDASYDPRNYLGYGNFDGVPTRYVATPDFETASDESWVDFDGDGVGELAVGRLPARNLAGAQLLVNKLLAYFPAPAGRGATLVADLPEGYDFAAMNQELSNLLPAGMPVTSINRLGQTDEAVRQQIVTAFNAGPALVQYAGHGSLQVWTGAPIFNQGDAQGLTNGNRLPLVVTMTCLNGYFQDVTSPSLAEGLMLAPQGGAIAVWASSGMTIAPGQTPLARAFYRAYGAGGSVRLGDAVRQAKQETTDLEVRRTWILFGDPTLLVR